VKTVPKINRDDIDKINLLDLPKYFDDYIKRRPASASGYISLAKENFRKMVNKAESESDMKVLIEAYANYIGHRNIIPQSYIESMVEKAID
jgi:hypothetical protein